MIFAVPRDGKRAGTCSTKSSCRCKCKADGDGCVQQPRNEHRTTSLHASGFKLRQDQLSVIFSMESSGYYKYESQPCMCSDPRKSTLQLRGVAS